MSDTSTNEKPAVEEGVIVDKAKTATSLNNSDMSKEDALAMFSFILSLLGLAMCMCAGVFSFPIPAIALWLYYAGGRNSVQNKQIADAGAVLSAASIAFMVISTICVVCFYGYMFATGAY